MSISLATKGVICPKVGTLPTPEPGFVPIFRFDVELLLDKPLGLAIESIEELAQPSSFMVQEVVDDLSAPKGFFIEADQAPSGPSSFMAEDLDFVSAPMGFAVEDI